MGALGCKYCNCDREKMEDVTDEMKIQYNNPIIITNGNKTKNNENNAKNENYNENQLNQNNDLNNNINIGNNTINVENINPLKNIIFSKEESNDNKNSNIIDNENNNIKPIEESNNIFNKKNTNNKNNFNINNDNKDNLININNENNNNKNDLINNENINNEEFIIENNDMLGNGQNNQKNVLKESKENQFSITNTKEAKNKIKKYEINKIKFGLEKEDKDNLNQEQQKLYNEAENNLKQFNPPQGNEMTQLQTIMSNILFKLKNIFTNIDLNSNKDDQENFLLNGILQKMINYQINAHNPTMYSERFCVLYPKMLKYYKSQAQFLKNLQPLCILPIDYISAVNIAKPKKSKNKIYHLIICNKLGIKKSVNNNVFLKLFDSIETNEFFSSPDLNESLLIFTSGKEEVIYKWYIVIQYLIEFSKK